MHASPLLLAALTALSTSALAAPSAATAAAAPAAAADFSFAQWIEDIIADPSGAHLSPAEAVEAKNAAVAASSSPFQKRINCDKAWARANVGFALLPFPPPPPFPPSPSPQALAAQCPNAPSRPTTPAPVWRTSRAKAPRAPRARSAPAKPTCRCAGLGTRR